MSHNRSYWKTVTLGEVCTFHGGTQPPKNTFKFRPEPGYIRLLQIRDFESDEHATYVSKAYNLRVVSEQDVLLARYGASVGKILRGKSGAINVALMKAEPQQDKVSHSFLFYILQLRQVQRYLKGLGGRSAQAGFNQGELNRIELPLPSLREQQQITDLLDCVNSLRDECFKEANLALERQRAVTDYLFGSENRDDARNRNGIPHVSKESEFVKLGDIGTIRYGLGQPPEVDPTGVPMIRATDIKRGRILYENAIRVRQSAIPEGRNPYLSKGDILVVRSGAYTGDVAVYDGRWERAIAGYDLVLSLDVAKARPVYVCHYLLGEQAQQYFRSQRDRAAQAHINAASAVSGSTWLGQGVHNCVPASLPAVSLLSAQAQAPHQETSGSDGSCHFGCGTELAGSDRNEQLLLNPPGRES